MQLMSDQILAFVVEEGKWLTFSLGLALLGISVLLYRYCDSLIPMRRRITTAMNLFFGITIGTMALGHLLAVTTKLILGTLEGTVLVFYGIGIALAIPSWWLIIHTLKMRKSESHAGRMTIVLNLWVVVTLLAFGLHNLPLAAPAFLNIGYQLHSRRLIGWTIVGLAVIVSIGLFIASLVFLSSGQSFEQFSDVD